MAVDTGTIQRILTRVKSLVPADEGVGDEVVKEIIQIVIDRIVLRYKLKNYPTSDSPVDSVVADIVRAYIRQWQGGYEGKTSENADGTINVGLITDLLNQYNGELAGYLSQDDPSGNGRKNVRFM